MPQAKPLTETASAADVPGDVPEESLGTCPSCGLPIKRGQVVQRVLVAGSDNESAAEHLTCWRKRAESLARAKRPKG